MSTIPTGTARKENAQSFRSLRTPTRLSPSTLRLLLAWWHGKALPVHTVHHHSNFHARSELAPSKCTSPPNHSPALSLHKALSAALKLSFIMVSFLLIISTAPFLLFDPSDQKPPHLSEASFLCDGRVTLTSNCECTKPDCQNVQSLPAHSILTTCNSPTHCFSYFPHVSTYRLTTFPSTKVAMHVSLSTHLARTSTSHEVLLTMDVKYSLDSIPPQTPSLVNLVHRIRWNVRGCKTSRKGLSLFPTFSCITNCANSLIKRGVKVRHFDFWKLQTKIYPISLHSIESRSLPSS